MKKQLELEQLKLRRAQQRAGVTLNPNPKPQTLQPRVWGEKIHSLHINKNKYRTVPLQQSHKENFILYSRPPPLTKKRYPCTHGQRQCDNHTTTRTHGQRQCDNHTTTISSSPFSKLLGPRLSSLCGKKQISQIFENISSLPFWQLLGPRLSVLCGKKQISQKNNEHISPFPFWLLLGPRLSSLYGD